jgi:hypothetical protein
MARLDFQTAVDRTLFATPFATDAEGMASVPFQKETQRSLSWSAA